MKYVIRFSVREVALVSFSIYKERVTISKGYVTLLFWLLTELANMAMGALTTASGEASATDVPGYAMYGKKAGDGANGHCSPEHRHHKEQHMSVVIEDDDSPGDANKPPPLVVTDLDNGTSPLRGLYKLRKNRSFCDVILQVASHESPFCCGRVLGERNQCPDSLPFKSGSPRSCFITVAHCQRDGELKRPHRPKKKR